MAIALWCVGGVLVVGLALALWRWTGPGTRIRVGDLNLYYTAGVAREVARRVAEHLVQQRFALDARLTRADETYQLQLICSTGQPDEKQNAACEVLAAGLADDVLDGAAVEVQVCDNLFRPTAVIRHRGRFGRRLAMNAAHLFYLNGVTEDEALAVATFLAGVGVFDDAPKIAQMNRTADGFAFRLAVDVDPLSAEMIAGAAQMAQDLSQRLFAGRPIAVEFAAGLLGTLRIETEAGAAANRPASGGPYHTQTFSEQAQG